MQSWDCGVIVPGAGDAGPAVPVVARALAAIDAPTLAARRAAVAGIPRDRLEMDGAECRRLTRAICGENAEAAT